MSGGLHEPSKNDEPKSYSSDEFKKVVQQRDESKQRVTELTSRIDHAQTRLESNSKELDEIKKKLTDARNKTYGKICPIRIDRNRDP